MPCDRLDLDYTDDVALLAEQTGMLQQALEQFRFEAAKLGLHLSRQKTKVQNLGVGDQEPDVVIFGNVVEGVTEFRYLGCIQSSSGRCHEDICRRIGVASSAMQAM